MIRYHLRIVNFGDDRSTETGWRNLDGHLLDRTFSRVDLSPYEDTELSFDETAKEVIVSKLCVRVGTDKGVSEIGIGVDLELLSLSRAAG